jgi:hypothetical protein
VPERTRPQVAGSVTGVAYLAVITVIAVVLTAGQAAGHYPTTPLAQVADVILVIKPHERYSLHLPATVDRIVLGDIVRIEKGVLPKMIVHTRNTFTLPLEAGVPVKLFLSPFKDGHGHYIIGVSREPSGGKP